MYAVVKTGGKQYRVEPGMLVEVEKLVGEVGDTVEFSEVLLVDSDSGLSIGQPQVKGAKVVGQIVEHTKDEKKIIYKKLRRHGKRLKKGHRQQLTCVRVNEIQL